MLITDNQVEYTFDAKELAAAVNAFLGRMSKRNRILFVRRYWYMDSIKDIAAHMGMTENNVKVSLKRSRDKLKKYLLEEGFLYE